MQRLKKRLFILCSLTGSFCSAQNFTTPEVFSFKQEVFRPISYYTGQANISIPILQVQTNEINIPVSLTYIGGEGLRPINSYSSVGLGWRLSVGGAITRTKNGLCDEASSYSGHHLTGFFNLPPNTVTNSYVRNNVSSYVSVTSGDQTFSPQIEYSPDVFSFSFLGYSGYFLMGYDGEFKIQSQDIVAVEKSVNNSYPGLNNGIQFKLTCNDGTMFTFGSTNGSIELSGGNDGIPFQCDAWYLTQIESANGRIINFEYQPNTATFVYFKTSDQEPRSATCPVVLENITFNGGKVVFTSSVVTHQIYNTSYPSLIDKVELQDANNKPISTANFTYSDEKSNRYHLLDCVIINDKKYSFEYYKRTELPDGNAVFGADYWGFFNGSQQIRSIPAGNVYPEWDMYLNPSMTIPQRMPSEYYAKIGILTSITYPTGGVESYEYESNTYSYVGKQTLGGTYYSFSEVPKKAGGLRIAKITLGNIVRKYKYVNSFDPDNPDYNPVTMSYIGYSSSGILYRIPGVPYFGRNVLNFLSIDGEPPIVYSTVIEFLSDKSYTQYDMRSPLNKPDGENNQNPSYFSVWSSQPNIFTAFPQIGFVGSLGKNSSRSLERGQVSAIKVYDASNTLKKSTEYLYASDPNRYGQYVSSVYITSTGGDLAMQELGLELGTAYYQKRLFFSVIHSYCIYTFPVYLEQSVETNYEGSNVIQRTTQYQYNNQKLKSAIISNNSRGDVIKTSFRYPADVNTGIYASMVTKKMLNYPIEQIQLKNNSITDSKLTTFKLNGSSYVPDKKYSLEMTSSFSESAFSYFNGTVKDSRYGITPEITFNSYNTLGNVMQVTGKNSMPTSYQWAYNDLYPVAQVINAENTVTTTNTQRTIYGALNMPASIASVSFTTTSVGNILLSIMGDPGNTYAISYLLTGPTTRTGNLCASRSSTTCSYPETLTLTGMPVGTYSLQISLFAGTGTYKGINYHYQGNHTVTTVIKEFFYQGFEEESAAATNGPFAGLKYYNGDYKVPYATPNARSYLVNYRYLEGSIWKSTTKTFTSNMTLTEGTAIDEVRVYPSDAQMTTYTYNPLIGMTSQCDPNSKITYYEYDGIGRLALIRDQDRNIIKKFDYQYQHSQ